MFVPAIPINNTPNLKQIDFLSYFSLVALYFFRISEMFRSILFIYLLIFLTPIIHGEVKDSSYLKSLQNISEENIRTYVRFLGSDAFEGRGTGTAGGNLAAKYIARELELMKLKPAGPNNSFFQLIQMHGSFPLPSSQLKIFSGENEFEKQLGKDYLLYKSGEQTFIPSPLPLVFVGYGIVATEFDYNDYQNLDVEGKVVVYLEGEPVSHDPDFFNGGHPSIYSFPESKQRIAISRGAAGSIQIPIPFGNTQKDWDKIRRDFEFEDVKLAYSVSSNLNILMNPAAANNLFRNSELSLHDVYNLHFQKKTRSFPLASSISFRGEFKRRDFIAPNVAAILEGSDPDLKDSYLIISAHYDHLGIGPPVNGDSIYNGVHDNALGVAALIDIADAFVSLPEATRRSIIFLFTTGEEKGLLGSIYYTDNPLKPLYKTIANINLDGMAMFEGFKSIVGVGSEFSSLDEYLKDTAEEFELMVEAVPSEFKGMETFTRSDQVAFALAGIPAVLVLEGPENKYYPRREIIEHFIHYDQNIYHTPADDLEQDINYKAARDLTKVIFSLCYRLANSYEVPEWHPGVPFINARLRSIAERR